jgi:hypothetical protein
MRGGCDGVSLRPDGQGRTGPGAALVKADPLG